MELRNFAYFLLLVGSLVVSSHCGAEATDEEEQAMVLRGNQRCDDFYRYQRERAEADVRREKDAQEIKRFRTEHGQMLELARRDYVKNRKATVVDPRLEKEYNDQDLAWKEQMKIARKRYAQRKAAVAAASRKGCHVPENKEYDLED